ncbi:MAG: tRNA preQ1(34) S-adenosylmethionine ribosyltransferase-isomerase QueA [Acidimicrobiales bacterium]
MDTAEFDYELPPERIAQTSVEPRSAARLLVDEGPGRAPQHRRVADLAELLDPGDVLAVNDTRVLAARVALRRPSGAAVEALLLERLEGRRWEALLRPSRRVHPGDVLENDAGLVVTALEPRGEGRWVVELPPDAATEEAAAALLAVHGQIPLPPYISEPLADPERYQTVYAARPVSAAAPTAGLHLTPEVLAACRAKGVTVAAVELAVGLGTFRPITATRVEDHRMHAEAYRIPPAALAALERPAGQVVAVGTTVVRALESWAATGRTEGRTELYLHGEARFAVVQRLLTNFHVPRSSLLVLIDAFVGPRWRDLYEDALAAGYRFLSFGDAMLLQRRRGPRRADRG